jgi:hypothetical protein
LFGVSVVSRLLFGGVGVFDGKVDGRYSMM